MYKTQSETMRRCETRTDCLLGRFCGLLTGLQRRRKTFSKLFIDLKLLVNDEDVVWYHDAHGVRNLRHLLCHRFERDGRRVKAPGSN